MAIPAQWEGDTPADVQFLCVALALSEDGYKEAAIKMLHAACAFGYITDSDVANAIKEIAKC